MAMEALLDSMFAKALVSGLQKTSAETERKNRVNETLTVSGGSALALAGAPFRLRGVRFRHTGTPATTEPFRS